jgi:hypothetical protein
MKKIITSSIIYVFLISTSFGQSVQASIGLGSVANSVKVYLKTTTPIGSAISISTLQFDVAIPTAFTPRPTPTLTPNTVNFAPITWVISNGDEGGYYHYIIETPTSPIAYTKLDGSEIEVFQISFSGATTPQFSLVTLPDGGGVPVHNAAIFLATSGTVQSDGSNLYYARPGTTVSNGFSYDLVNGLSGTTTSFATIGTGVVPVKFSSFSATKKDKDAILSWVVENETATVINYEVERSIDGINFDKINTIAKNSGTSNIYNITDANLSAVKNNGIIYYRIKQIDVDGKFVYSDIKNVRLSEKGTLISLFPNPVQEFTTVKIDATEATDAIVTLINADGKQMQTSILKATKGLNLHKLDMSNLSTGDYLLKVTMGTEVQIIKVVKL